MLMTTTVPATFQDAHERLLGEGYRPGVPAHVQAFARTVDEGVCREAFCEVCGNHGLTYKPYRREKSYRVLGVCPACQAVTEI